MNNSPDSHRAERGFGLVELLVVMVIVAVIAGIAMTSLRAARAAGSRKEAKVAAHSMQKAVESFRIDREGRVPSSRADWGSDGGAGPVDMETTRPYLRGVLPTSMIFEAQGIAPARPAELQPGDTAIFTVRYQAIAAPAGGTATTYRITVLERGTALCTLSNVPMGGDQC